MARPKKPAGEKRSKRLTHYMTADEEKMLEVYSEHLGLDKTKIVQKALDRYFQMVENPPEAIVQSKNAEMMNVDEVMLQGFICTNGHLFWMEWAYPAPPSGCPTCGNVNVKRTWSGKVKKGF